jgi:serine protease Do
MKFKTAANLSSIFIAVGLLAACNTTSRMVVPTVTSQPLLNVRTPVEKQASFALSKVIANIKRGTVIGKYPGGGIEGVKGTLCNHRGGSNAEFAWGAGSSVLGNWSTELGEVFYEALSQSGVNVAGDPRDLFGRETSANSAEYLVGSRITKVASNICQEHDAWDGMPRNSFGGELFIDVDWTILSSLSRQTVLNVQTQGYHKAVQPKPDGIILMFHNAFAEASENLLTSAEFVALAERRDDNDVARTFAGSELKLELMPRADRSIEAHLESVLSSVATIRIGQGHGSGFFISEDGYLLTNAHVVGDAQKVSVILNNGLEVPGDVVRRLKSRDIALIKVGLRVPTALPLRSASAKKLERVFVVGTPLKESLGSTVTAGIISGFRTEKGQRFIQADAPISPGNSGGPLIDQNGNVLGVSVAKYVGRGSEGISLFIPIDDALSALKISRSLPAS